MNEIWATVDVLANWNGVISDYDRNFQFFSDNSLQEVTFSSVYVKKYSDHNRWVRWML